MPNAYICHSDIEAFPEHADKMADVLLKMSQIMRSLKGCRLHVVAKDTLNPNLFVITEIWDTLEDFDNALKTPGVGELLLEAQDWFKIKKLRDEESHRQMQILHLDGI